jgi:hypothetical protein
MSGVTMKELRISFFFFFLITLVPACKPPRCPLASCHVRMRHRHGETEYRGVPWWKRNKNPKYGEDYKDPAEGDKKKSAKEAKDREKQINQKKKDAYKQ